MELTSTNIKSTFMGYKPFETENLKNVEIYTDFNNKTYYLSKNKITYTGTNVDDIKNDYIEFLIHINYRLWNPRFFKHYSQEFKNVVIQLYLINKRLNVIHKDVMNLIIEEIAKAYLPIQINSVSKIYKNVNMNVKNIITGFKSIGCTKVQYNRVLTVVKGKSNIYFYDKNIQIKTKTLEQNKELETLIYKFN